MPKHSHRFVETHDGFVGFGLGRQTDEQTVMYYAQKFSDDALIRTLTHRMTDDELEEIFDMINRMLKKYLKDDEYHDLFLKDDQPHGG